MKNGGGHFAPELGGHFELESGAHFKLELGGQYHWYLQCGISKGYGENPMFILCLGKKDLCMQIPINLP